MEKRIQEAAEFLNARLGITPEIGLITGTGLGGVTGRIQIDVRLPYREIPHFPQSTTAGHRGTLLCGTLGGRPLLAMEGRFHAYEGYSPLEVTFPVRVMARLGIRTLLMSSAAGGLDPQFSPGDLMLVTDHINLMGTNPLAGPNLETFGPRFPDMSAVYDRGLRTLAAQTALEAGTGLKQGVYAGIPGPSLETPAETRFLRGIGSDAVGMSTVPEAIVAVHCGMRILAIVVVTNVNLPDCMAPTAIEDVIAVAERAGESLSRLWERIVSRIPA